jgi:hypothetical protein
LIRFAAALTLTHNPVSLILPGGADILTAAGDTALATSDADGNWRVRHYQRADGTALVGGGGGGVNARELLTAVRTYYVSTSGSDANDGRSPGAPFATLQKAIDTVASLDLGVHNATIELAAGAYTAGAALKTLTGAGKCIILGDEATPTNVDIQVTGGNCFSSEPVRGTYALRGMRLRTTTSGHCIFVQGNGLTVELQNVNFGASAGQHINVRSGAQVLQTGNYSISGGATVHWNAVAGGKIEAQGFTIALTGTPAFLLRLCVGADRLHDSVGRRRRILGFRHRAALQLRGRIRHLRRGRRDRLPPGQLRARDADRQWRRLLLRPNHADTPRPVRPAARCRDACRRPANLLGRGRGSWTGTADAGGAPHRGGDPCRARSRPGPPTQRGEIVGRLAVDRRAARRGAGPDDEPPEGTLGSPGHPAVYADDPETVSLLQAIGADPELVLAPP